MRGEWIKRQTTRVGGELRAWISVVVLVMEMGNRKDFEGMKAEEIRC